MLSLQHCVLYKMLFRTEDESSEGSVPELVSADESDTSSGESDTEVKRDMPDLLDEDASDSNESGIDEVCTVLKRAKYSRFNSKR